VALDSPLGETGEQPGAGDAPESETALADSAEDDSDEADVLLIEAGRILADALALTGNAPPPTVTAQR